MSDPILHIKDGYFFEVPKALWRADYKSMEDVPVFLTKLHAPKAGEEAEHQHQFTLQEYDHAMDGKILIPQPFGTIRDLHTPASGFCISKFMILEVVVALILFCIFKGVAKSLTNTSKPHGRVVNAFEAILLYLRDEVVRPSIGGKEADKFLPILWTMFFFILGCNLIGMLPWMGAPTGAFGVTLTLAFVTLAVGFIAGAKKFGVVGYWTNMVPHMDLPWYMSPIKGVILILEIVGLFIKHGVLGIRLLANMTAGHLVLLGIMGLISTAAASSLYVWGPITAITVIGSALFSVMELFVAFLQAYIFMFLSSLFISAAIHSH